MALWKRNNNNSAGQTHTHTLSLSQTLTKIVMIWSETISISMHIFLNSRITQHWTIIKCMRRLCVRYTDEFVHTLSWSKSALASPRQGSISLSASPFESPRTTTTTTSRVISNHHATYQAIRGFRFVENPTVSYPLSDTNPADVLAACISSLPPQNTRPHQVDV